MIICGALKITLPNGEEKIIRCHRHSDAYRIIRDFGIERRRSKDVQGFIKWIPDPEDPFYTENEEFIDRDEAFRHAQECGQISKDEPERELFTEDIY